MITVTPKPELNTREKEETEVIVVRYEPGTEPQGNSFQLIRRLLRAFGLLSTTAWTAAALLPNTFNVPQNFRGWFFVIWVFWFFGFCAGLFNL